ncbi:ABC transporter permease [Campylobacter sp. MIT 21-1685]|uniref:methionine ABC transporter permease n=1 Tax=unclassified Campylobacter TaxID=2593542 RepID=UPI00224A89B1|nr:MULTISPECIES: methionine ABC transporter permease [unclassified Campylobacter]MCX2683001.1 ABC transporter permease [Campylobacter sp. MIT 21-1684]MCX2751283.1 ABC transporter permease [Campylobacter sp. MIT 21-1682]MCX2807482.1 ABC transporter permease [Campylobacter sp. MIT 21-1685]
MNENQIIQFFNRISQFFTDFSLTEMEQVLLNSVNTFGDNYQNILKQALNETLYMSISSLIFGFLLAFFPAILLTIYDKEGIKHNKLAYGILDFITNILRAFPFLILIVILLPLSKLIVGTSIGTSAAIVPLTIGISPYLAKMLENAFKEVDKGIIEAAKSYGANNTQIIFKIILTESLPSIINGVTLIFIFIIGFSALAGTVGGGGLGDVAIRYGYERFNKEVMIQTVIILLLLVQLVQIVGNLCYTWAKNNKNLRIVIVLFILVTVHLFFNFYDEKSVIWQIIVAVFLLVYWLYKKINQLFH